MVANSEKLDVRKDVKNSNVSMVDNSIIDFLHRNPCRVLIVDFLNVMIGGDFNARNVTELCDVLKVRYSGTPLIIVTKKVAFWPNIDADTAKRITKSNPNILILICDTRDVKKQVSETDLTVDASLRKDVVFDLSLAEADDNLIALLELAMRSASFAHFAGCGPKILTRDKYRNKVHVFETIPRYGYTTYHLGTDTDQYIDPELKLNWVFNIASNTAATRQKCCYTRKPRRCQDCNISGATCPECKICWNCNMELRQLINEFGPSPNVQDSRDHLRDSPKDIAD